VKAITSSKKLSALLPVSAPSLVLLLVTTWLLSDIVSQAAPPGVLTLPEETVPENAEGKKPDIDVTAKDLAVLYSNKDNPIIERFSLTGEFQLQWADGTSNQGSYGTRDVNSANRWGDVEVRRWRTGFESTWFDNFKAWGTIDINPNWTPFYKDIYELAVSYSPSEAFNLGVGKIKTRYFSQEWNTRTRENITFENSLLVNELIPQQLTGAWVNGTSHHWVYALAIYAGDYEPEFSQFNAGEVTQASLGYDFASALNVDKALVKLDYQGSTSTKNSNGPGAFKDAFSLNSTFQNHRFYGYTDLLGGIGQGKQGDVWGVTLTPTYFVIPNRLQAIVRYQYAHGNNDGLRLQTRYEELAPGIISTKGAGDEYNAVYFGLNYYIFGHNLKLMAGTEYNDMSGGKKDFSGWTTLLGIRAAF
jgi:phosphate-selective porin OprO and OprP